MGRRDLVAFSSSRRQYIISSVWSTLGKGLQEGGTFVWEKVHVCVCESICYPLLSAALQFFYCIVLLFPRVSLLLFHRFAPETLFPPFAAGLAQYHMNTCAKFSGAPWTWGRRETRYVKKDGQAKAHEHWVNRKGNGDIPEF